MHCHLICIFGLKHAAETLDHCYKSINGLQRSRLESICISALQHFPHGDVLLICKEDRFINCCLTNTSRREIDDTLKSLFVTWIDDHAQISDKIFYLLPLIEADASINGIGNTHSAKVLFKRTTL